MKGNFGLWVGIPIMIVSVIILAWPFISNHDGMQTTEKISVAYDNNVVNFSNFDLNLVTIGNPEYIFIDYAILRNESKAGFIAITLPYSGHLQGDTNGWSEQPFPLSHSVVIFKKIEKTNKTTIGSDQANLYFQLDEKVESIRYPNNYVQLPFANNPLDSKIIKFINDMSPVGPAFTSGWGKINTPHIQVTIDKKFDQWSSQPTGEVRSSPNFANDYSMILERNITDNNPLFTFEYANSQDIIIWGVYQTIGGSLIAVGVSSVIGGFDQKRSERFIRTQQLIQAGSTAFLLKEYGAAENSFEQAIKMDSKNIDFRLLAGNAFFEMKKYRNALPYYEQILDLKSDHVGALNNIGICYDRLGDKEKALEFYEKALCVQPIHADTLNNMGAAIFDLGIADCALPYYEMALENNSDDPMTLTNKGKALHSLGNDNGAIECFDKVLKIDPKYLDALIGKGQIFYDLKDYRKAIECYDRILKIDPSETSSLYNIGSSYLHLDDYDNAILYSRQFLIVDSYNVDALSNIGIALAKKGKHTEAHEYYDTILKINSTHADTLYNKGLSFALEKEYQSAITYFDKFLKIEPNNITALINQASCLMNLQKYEEALTSLEKILKIDPTNVSAIEMKSVVENELRKISKE